LRFFQKTTEKNTTERTVLAHVGTRILALKMVVLQHSKGCQWVFRFAVFFSALVNPTRGGDEHGSSLAYSFGFHVPDASAQNLFEGCSDSRPQWANEKAIVADHRNPDIIVIGVQKGGTTDLATSFVTEFGKTKAWFAVAGAQFFSKINFRDRAPEAQEYRGYMSRFKTGANHHQILAEKSPSYLTTEWAPLRACQTTPNTTKFVLLLREPISRAYSGFFQGKPLFSNVLPNVTRGADGFAVLAKVEADVIRKCNPFGTNNLTEDQEHEKKYVQCCTDVAKSHGHDRWFCLIKYHGPSNASIGGKRLPVKTARNTWNYNGGRYGTPTKITLFLQLYAVLNRVP
jgi:hypothetical protein